MVIKLCAKDCQGLNLILNSPYHGSRRDYGRIEAGGPRKRDAPIHRPKNNRREGCGKGWLFILCRITGGKGLGDLMKQGPLNTMMRGL